MNAVETPPWDMLSLTDRYLTVGRMIISALRRKAEATGRADVLDDLATAEKNLHPKTFMRVGIPLTRAAARLADDGLNRAVNEWTRPPYLRLWAIQRGKQSPYSRAAISLAISRTFRTLNLPDYEFRYHYKKPLPEPPCPDGVGCLDETGNVRKHRRRNYR